MSRIDKEESPSELSSVKADFYLVRTLTQISTVAAVNWLGNISWTFGTIFLSLNLGYFVKNINICTILFNFAFYVQYNQKNYKRACYSNYIAILLNLCRDSEKLRPF